MISSSIWTSCTVPSVVRIVQVQQRVHLDGRFLLAKLSPWREGEAEVDGGGVYGIQVLLQTDAKEIAGIERASDGEQDLREVGEDAPVPGFVAIGQRGARHVTAGSPCDKTCCRRSAGPLRCCAGFPVGQLGERSGEILTPAGQIPEVAITRHSGRRTSGTLG